MSRQARSGMTGWLAGLLLLLLWLPARAEDAPQAPAQRPDFSAFAPMIERPLFSNTRRPPALLEAPTENLDAQQLREAWRLSGIVLENSQQLAIFSQRQGEKLLQLEVGMVLADEWRLQRIERDRVWLGNNGTEVELLLREPQSATGTPEKTGKPATAPAAGEKPGKPAAPAAPSSMSPPKGRTAVIEPARRG